MFISFVSIVLLPKLYFLLSPLCVFCYIRRFLRQISFLNKQTWQMSCRPSRCVCVCVCMCLCVVLFEFSNDSINFQEIVNEYYCTGRHHRAILCSSTQSAKTLHRGRTAFQGGRDRGPRRFKIMK